MFSIMQAFYKIRKRKKGMISVDCVIFFFFTIAYVYEYNFLLKYFAAFDGI